MRPEAALYAAAEFVLLLDGVCVDGEDGPQFVAAPPVSDDDVQQIVETTAQRVVRLLQRRGLLDEGHADTLMEQEPLLATITAASVQGQVATGERAGQRVRRRLLDPQEGIRSGVLAPHAADRARIVPGPNEETCEAAHGRSSEPTAAQRRHRLAWSTLLARVFRVDVTVCPACGGPMKIVAALTEPRSIQRYLEGVGLPSRAPPIAPARPHPQTELEFAA